jgi:hypothetical protein
MRAALSEYMGRSADARKGGTAFLEKRPLPFAMRPSAHMPFSPWGMSGPVSP